MQVRRRKSVGWIDTLGMLSVLATLALLSPGVRIVRAESPPAALMSIDPALMNSAEVVADPVERADAKPGRPAVERQPGVIVLNTRGYNYGPPVGEVDPRAMDLEQRLDPMPPAAR